MFNSTWGKIMATHRNGYRKETFILSVDVGTTSIRCHVYDKEAKIRGTSSIQVIWHKLLPFPKAFSMTLGVYIKHCWWISGLIQICLPCILHRFPCYILSQGEWRWIQRSFGKALSQWWKAQCGVCVLSLRLLSGDGHCCWRLRISFYYVQIQAFRCSKWRP